MSAAPAKTEKSNKDLCRMISPTFRASYPHLFKPQSPDPNGKLKYSITMLYAKDSDLTGTTRDGQPRTLKEVIRNAKIAEFGPKENWPADLISPIEDGDSPKNADKKGYQGCWVIKASTNEDNRPSVVDQQMKPITDANVVYPGCYARAYIYAYVWYWPNKQKPTRKGVGFILEHVQKVGDGTPFGGKTPIEQVFSPIGEAPAAAAQDDDDDMDFK